MGTASSTSTRPASDPGTLLRTWRDLRGKSQLDLSLDTGISQKQISFIESGRSIPSRQSLVTLSRALDVPLRERNILLLAAGYAPIYSDGAWDSDEMSTITQALDRMLKQHEPFPAVVMDRYWTVLMANEATPRFFNHFVDMAARPQPRNLLHLMFDLAGMRPFIDNWDDTAAGLFDRVYRESVGRMIDEKTKELLAALLAYPGVRIEPRPVAQNPLPMIPMRFVLRGETLSYFSLITTVGTPQTIAAQELRLECLFPADSATEQAHARLMAQDSVPPIKSRMLRKGRAESVKSESVKSERRKPAIGKTKSKTRQG